MAQLKWTLEAARAYKLIYNENPSLRKLIDQRLKALIDWPPKKWFDLRDKDGIIRFQTENDQFIVLTGMVEEKEETVWIYRFELRTRRGK